MKQEILEKGKANRSNRFFYVSQISQLEESENMIIKIRGDKELTEFEMKYNSIIDQCKCELIECAKEEIKKLDKQFEEL